MGVDDDDIKQRRRCKCCNTAYDYAVAGSLATRFICAECMKIPEPMRRVLAIFNKRLVEIETKIKAQQPASMPAKAKSE